MPTTLPRTLCLAALAVAFVATDASAQPATAQAEVLFRDGKKLMAEGNIEAACEAFEGSYRKDPAVTTLMNLADCREKNQQYASAWAHFVEAGRQTARDPALSTLRTSSLERAAAVEGRLSYLIINVPNEAQVEGLVITRNGVVVDAIEWNRDIPIDGGTYEIVGKAPAYEAWSTKVTVGNAKDKQSVNVPRFREALVGPSTPTRSDDQPSSFGGKRKAALALGAVGLLALGGGLALELKSGNTYDDAKAAADNDERHALTDSANRERRIGMASGALGVVAVSAGVFLWFTGAPAERDGVSLAPQLGDGQAGLVVLGNF